MVKSKACKYCGSYLHTSLMCFAKPRARIRNQSQKSLTKEQVTKREWFVDNPADAKGLWYCYLRISPYCPVKLTRSTIELEHVESRARVPGRKYDKTNLRPACSWCNRLKGSMSFDEAISKYGQRVEFFKTTAEKNSLTKR